MCFIPLLSAPHLINLGNALDFDRCSRVLVETRKHSWLNTRPSGLRALRKGSNECLVHVGKLLHVPNKDCLSVRYSRMDSLLNFTTFDREDPPSSSTSFRLFSASVWRSQFRVDLVQAELTVADPISP